MVNVRVKGRRQTVLVDSYMPFYLKTSYFLFAREEKRKFAWAAALEKVWAKVNVNYDHIVGGDPLEAVEFLTGYPGFSYSLEYESGDITSAYNLWTYIDWAW